MSIEAKNGVETPPAPDKTQWRTENMSCKSMKQDENDENNKNEPTPVVGWKPYGKSQLIYLNSNDSLIFSLSQSKINVICPNNS